MNIGHSNATVNVTRKDNPLIIIVLQSYENHQSFAVLDL